MRARRPLVDVGRRRRRGLWGPERERFHAFLRDLGLTDSTAENYVISISGAFAEIQKGAARDLLDAFARVKNESTRATKRTALRHWGLYKKDKNNH